MDTDVSKRNTSDSSASSTDLLRLSRLLEAERKVGPSFVCRVLGCLQYRCQMFEFANNYGPVESELAPSANAGTLAILIGMFCRMKTVAGTYFSCAEIRPK